MKLEVRLLLLRFTLVTLLEDTVMPRHVFIFWVLAVPQVRSGLLEARALVLLLASAAQ